MLGGRICRHLLPAQHRKTAILLTLHRAIQTWLRLLVLELRSRGLLPGRGHARLAEPPGAVHIRCLRDRPFLPSKAGNLGKGIKLGSARKNLCCSELPLGNPTPTRRDAGGGNLVEDCTHDGLRFSEASYEATQSTHSGILQVL